MFPSASSRETSGLEGKKLTSFPRDLSDIKCFVIFLDFHFNSNKRIIGANPRTVDSVLITTQI